MNFKVKDWKKVKDTADHTYFKNSTGHELKVAKRPLSANMRKQLEELPIHKADGGPVDKGPAIDQDKAKDFQKGATEPGTRSLGDYIQNVKEGLGIASSEPKKYADGGEVDGGDQSTKPITINIGTPQNQMMPVPQAAQPPAPAPQPNQIDYNKAFENNPGQRWEPPTPEEKNTQAQQWAYDYAPYGTGFEAKDQEIAHQESKKAPPLPAPPVMSNQPQQAPNGAPSGMMDSYAGNMIGGYNQQVRAAQEQANAAKQLGAQASEIYGKQTEQDKNQIDLSQQTNAAINQERQHFIDDIKAGHINPQHFLENQSTGSKVMSTLGLILGGAGAGLSGQTNMAYDFINKQIDRDIKAQETNLSSDNNLLSNNIQHFQNQNTARQMLRMQYNDMYSHMIDQAKAQNMAPAAQAQADMLKGQLQQQNAMIASQIGAGAKGTPEDMLNLMRWTNPERAKEMESRYVPQVGFSQVPLTAEDRNGILAKQQLGRMSRDLYQWSSQHSGSVDPTIVNEGQTKAAELQSMYRNAINGGVFKKGEQEFIDTIVDSDPTKFFNNIRVLPKLKTIINSNDKQLGMLLQSKGFSGPGAMPQQQSQSQIRFKPGQ